jgi:hypothetical protein
VGRVSSLTGRFLNGTALIICIAGKISLRIIFSYLGGFISGEGYENDLLDRQCFSV